MPPRRFISGPARLALVTKGIIPHSERPPVKPARKRQRKQHLPPPFPAKLTLDQRAEIRRRQYEPQKLLAHEYGVSTGTISVIQDRPHKAQKLRPEQVADIRRRAAERLCDLAREYNVAIQLVWNIRHGYVGYAR